MAICNNCGADVAQGMKFCTSCGTAQLSNVDDGPVAQVADAAPQAPQQVYQPGDTQQQTHVQTPPPAAHNQQPTSQSAKNHVISTLGWLGVLILFAIPIVGFALCILWAFGDGNLNRRNFARACLIFSVIAIVLSIVFTFVLGPMAMTAIRNSAKPYIEQFEQIKEAADSLPKPKTRIERAAETPSTANQKNPTQKMISAREGFAAMILYDAKKEGLTYKIYTEGLISDTLVFDHPLYADRNTVRNLQLSASKDVLRDLGFKKIIIRGAGVEYSYAVSNL